LDKKGKSESKLAVDCKRAGVRGLNDWSLAHITREKSVVSLEDLVMTFFFWIKYLFKKNVLTVTYAWVNSQLIACI